MRQIIVEVSNKHIINAFLNVLIDNEFLLAFEENIDYNKRILIAIKENKRVDYAESPPEYVLPSQWYEALDAINEMISANDKKWTDQDVKDAISFSIKADDKGSIITDSYCNELFNNFIKDKIKRDEQQESIN